MSTTNTDIVYDPRPIPGPPTLYERLLNSRNNIKPSNYYYMNSKYQKIKKPSCILTWISNLCNNCSSGGSKR